MNSKVTSEQIHKLLLDPMDTWYFGKCLFYTDYYKSDKSTVGFQMNNICEIYSKIEREVKKRKWLILSDDTSSNLYYYYKLLSLSKTIWVGLKSYDINNHDPSSINTILNTTFYIPRDKVNILCDIIADSLNEKEFTT